MRIGNQEIILVGDRILIKPADRDQRTKVGLYLPDTVVAKEPVQTGRVMAVGPGIAVPDMAPDYDEPWKEGSKPRARYVPVQAHIGDFALFLRKEACEIRYADEEYLVVPQSAVLLLVRDDVLSEFGIDTPPQDKPGL